MVSTLLIQGTISIAFGVLVIVFPMFLNYLVGIYFVYETVGIYY